MHKADLSGSITCCVIAHVPQPAHTVQALELPRLSRRVWDGVVVGRVPEAAQRAQARLAVS